MHRFLVRVSLAPLLAVAIVACTQATAPNTVLLRQRAIWNAQRITDYSFDYEVTRFFITLRRRQVRAAADLRGGAPVAGC